ncbi:hypothetical protein T484DRAFT_1768656 [Baffinella frigidus]|nr:hypothetical protein T484DRAFT_1768656 [Cryptophyta sp. CCMP2293]
MVGEQGVDGPSQIRYVHYIEGVLNGRIDPLQNPARFLEHLEQKHRRIDPLQNPVRFLEHLELPIGLPQQRRPFLVSAMVKCARSVVFDSFASEGGQATSLFSSKKMGLSKRPYGSETAASPGTASATHISFPIGVPIWGDVRIEVYQHRSGTASRKLLFFLTFHTAAYQALTNLDFAKNKALTNLDFAKNKALTNLDFAKNKVDMIHKDKHCVIAEPSFSLP